MLTTELIVSLQFRSCSDIALICPCLKNPTFARSFVANFPSSECLVQCWRLALNWLHAFVQVLIVVFDSSATVVPSDCHSRSSTVWSVVSVTSTECTSSFRRLTVFGASLSFCRSSRRSLVPCKAGTATLTTLAAMLRGSAICSLFLLMEKFRCSRQPTCLDKALPLGGRLRRIRPTAFY